MKQVLPQEHVDKLESFVDTYGMASVLEALGEIAYEKAQHIHENWQDKGLARDWISASNKILSARSAVERLIP